MRPATCIRRCVFHVASQVRRCTTLSPNLEAERELLGIANTLKEARDAESAADWLASYSDWCAKWAGFLREFTLKEGGRQYVHGRLRKARRGLSKLVREGTLFTFAEMTQERGGEWPATNDVVESTSSRIRGMLRAHRGILPPHRIKAVFWWCHAHIEDPLPSAEILRVMPTDDQVGGLFAKAAEKNGEEGGAPEEYGSGID